MIVRLAVVTTLIAVFGLSFSVLADNARHRSVAAAIGHPSGQTCLGDGLVCAPGAGARN